MSSKNTLLLIVALIAFGVSCKWTPYNNMPYPIGYTPIAPTVISFSAPAALRMSYSDKLDASDAARIMDSAKPFLGSNIVIDGVVRGQSDITLVRSIEDGVYADADLIRVVAGRTPPLNSIRDLEEARALLGLPTFAEGPIDESGDVVNLWRYCRYESGTIKDAFQITAVVRGSALRLVLIQSASTALLR